MINKLKIVFILVTISMIILLGTQVKANLVLQDIVLGTWKINSIKQNGKELTSEDSMFVDLIIGGTIVLTQDGKYTCNVPVLEFVGMSNSGTYSIDGENKIKVIYGTGETGTITYNSTMDALVLENKSYVVTAVRQAESSNKTDNTENTQATNGSETSNKDNVSENNGKVESNKETEKEQTTETKKEETKVEENTTKKPTSTTTTTQKPETTEVKKETSKDSTTSNTKLPKTGKGMTVTIALGIAILVAIVGYRKYKSIEIY